MKKTNPTDDPFPQLPQHIRISIIVLMVAVVAVGSLLPLLLSEDSKRMISTLRARYRIGTLAKEDVVASHTFYYTDEEKTEEVRKQEVGKVLPVFRYSLVESRKVLDAIDRLWENANAYQAQNSDTKDEYADMVAFLAQLDVEERKKLLLLVTELVNRLLEDGVFDEEELVAVSNEGYEKIFVAKDYGASSLLEERAIDQCITGNTLESVLYRLLGMESGSSLPLFQQLMVFDLISFLVKPNMYYDTLETALRREEASRTVEPVVVKVEEGQIILKKDFVITEDALKTLEAMYLSEATYPTSKIIGHIIFTFLITYIAVYAIHRVFLHQKRSYQYIIIFLVGSLLTLVVTYLLLGFAARYALPLMEPFLPAIGLPILMALLTNRKRAGMISAAALGSWYTLLPGATVTTVFFITALAFCGIYFIRYVERRIDMIFQWFFSVIVSSFLVILHNLINGFGFTSIMGLISAITVNVTITYILVTVLLPIIENLFNLPTAFRLRELAYGDSPTLQRLSQVAQGTYNHSLVVADLAYEAAKEIGADPLLARVGALYHDIGKMDNPEYFVENREGSSKHEELKPSLSAAIIKSHVKIGAEKGRQIRLPQEVLDIINQHHGNDVIAVFYKEAQEAGALDEKSLPVKASDYAYTSPIPQTPEAAVVMLADSVEAASRTVKKPSAQKYERLIQQIIMGKIERKQLSASRLSLTDLDRIAQVFVKQLTGRSHMRIEYPTVQKESK